MAWITQLPEWHRVPGPAVFARAGRRGCGGQELFCQASLPAFLQPSPCHVVCTVSGRPLWLLISRQACQRAHTPRSPCRVEFQGQAKWNRWSPENRLPLLNPHWSPKLPTTALDPVLTEDRGVIDRLSSDTALLRGFHLCVFVKKVEAPRD